MSKAAQALAKRLSQQSVPATFAAGDDAPAKKGTPAMPPPTDLAEHRDRVLARNVERDAKRGAPRQPVDPAAVLAELNSPRVRRPRGGTSKLADLLPAPPHSARNDATPPSVITTPPSPAELPTPVQDLPDPVAQQIIDVLTSPAPADPEVTTIAVTRPTPANDPASLTLDDAHYLGTLAAGIGETPKANPFKAKTPRETELRAAWHRGFNEGKANAPVRTQPAPVVVTDHKPNPYGVGLHLVDLSHLDPSPDQTRTYFDPPALDELADSIEKSGLAEPIVARVKAEGEGGPTDAPLFIVAGERRYRAFKALHAAGKIPHGQDTASLIPAIIREYSPAEAAAITTVENLQRADLNPIEEAKAFARLATTYGMSQSQIGEKVGKKQATISNALRLLELPEGVQSLVVEGKLSTAHAKALLPFRNVGAGRGAVLMTELAKHLIAHPISSKHAEATEWLGDFNLSNRNVTKAMDQWDTAFDIEKMCAKACPFNAYRKAGGRNICLHPAHYGELQRDAKAEAQRRIQEATSAAKAEGRALPKINTLPRGSFEVVGMRDPKGCGTSCVCRAKAVGHGGDIVEICTDTKRYSGLRQTEERERQRKDLERNTKLAHKVREWIPAQLGQPNSFTRERMAFTLTLLLADLHDDAAPALADALKRRGVDYPAVERRPLAYNRRHLLYVDYLAGHLGAFTLAELVDLGIEVHARHQAARLDKPGTPHGEHLAILTGAELDDPGPPIFKPEPAAGPADAPHPTHSARNARKSARAN